MWRDVLPFEGRILFLCIDHILLIHPPVDRVACLLLLLLVRLWTPCWHLLGSLPSVSLSQFFLKVLFQGNSLSPQFSQFCWSIQDRGPDWIQRLGTSQGPGPWGGHKVTIQHSHSGKKLFAKEAGGSTQDANASLLSDASGSPGLPEAGYHGRSCSQTPVVPCLQAASAPAVCSVLLMAAPLIT